MPKGVIGIASAESARYSLFYATLDGMKLPPDTEIIKVHARSAVISENRNNITQTALDAGADWVLYLDDDHILRDDTLLRLLAADVPVISAHYTQRTPPFNCVAMSTELPTGGFLYKQLASHEQGVISVAAVGAGCLLVRRPVLEAIPTPYWTLGQIHPASWGDDLHWCSRVRAAGFEIHLDLDNYIGHIFQGVVWPKHDAEGGWLAYVAQDPGKSLIARIPMPLAGDA